MLSRWAVGLALLALLAQALAVQASAGHLAGMLSARWLTGQVCTGAGAPLPLAEFGDPASDGEAEQPLAPCPLCAVAVMPLLGPQAGPEAPPLPLAEHQGLPLAAATPPREAPPHLLPPAQGPPPSA